MPDKNWQFELEEYIKQGEPDRAEKSEAWQTAIGLQAVDGLNTSAYLLDTAKDHIEGKITIDEAQKRIHSYYEQRSVRTETENETKEADIVSARITKLLGEKAFQFSPAEWITIHRRLFEGVFDHAGQIRQYNITKKEWVLNGDTVIYADWNSIKETLDYDFATEKQFSYEGLSVEAAVKHLAKFASDIWQIHPFGEGNTRATAVFMIKYMKTFVFRVNNDAFRENSWYFRNALVRANYNNLQKGVHSTTKFLELFFSNLLLGTKHELKNRYMHIDFADESALQSINSKVSKYQFDTLDCTIEELAVLELVAKNPAIKQQEIAEQTGKSIATIKRIMKRCKIKIISAVKVVSDTASGKCWFEAQAKCRMSLLKPHPISVATPQRQSCRFIVLLIQADRDSRAKHERRQVQFLCKHISFFTVTLMPKSTKILSQNCRQLL